MPTTSHVVDAYTHWAAPEFLKYLGKEGGKNGPYDAFYQKNPLFHDVGARLEYMDEYKIDCSILTPTPWIESVPRVANDPREIYRGRSHMQ